MRACITGWNDGSVLTVTGGATVTWSARTVLMPATYGRRGQHPDPRPALIVNPGLESILLERRGGRWQPGHDAQLRAAGLVPPGRQLRLDRPVPGVTARAAGGDIAVTLELRGVLLIMTSAVNPGELTSRTGPAQIGGALTSPSTLAGWVALNPAP
jgi:hypothetical protein